MDQKRLQELRESEFSFIVREYLREEIEKMSNVNSHLSWDDVLGKQKAVKILTELIRNLEIKIEEKKLPNQYK